MKKIGIIGGMGPEATAELYLRIIKLFQYRYSAKYDSDFPEIIIISLPIPDVVENEAKEKVPSSKDEISISSSDNIKIREMLVDAAIRLEKAGAEFIAVPCNTVTIFIKEMQNSVKIKIINIVEETIKEIKKQNLNKVGIVATETTIGKNLYNADFILSVDQQKETTKIIMNILSGKKNEEDKLKLDKYIEELIEKGSEKVILGCTELPLLINGERTIDTIDVLAESVIKYSVLLPSQVINKNIVFD